MLASTGLALLWLALLVALAGAALPLATRLLAPLGAAAAPLAYPLSAAVLVLLTRWIGVLTYGPPAAVGAVVVLLGGSLLADRTGGPRPPWRAFAGATALFAGAFCLAVVLRAADPGLVVWAEGPLNLGLVATLLRTPALPPTDMWFAGEPVRYHYGGHLLAATWAHLTGTPARLVPNLAVPAVYATLVTAVAGLAGAVGATRGLGRRAAGAAVLLVGAGWPLFDAARVLVQTLPAGLATAVRGALGLPAGPLGGFSAFAATHWAAVPTDVPLYSVVVGSLHAHVLSQPLTLLVGALALGTLRTPASRPRARAGRLGAALGVAGAVWFVNAWSLPVAVGLVALTVAADPDHPATLLPGRVRARLPAAPLSGRLVAVPLVLAFGVGVAALAVAPYVATASPARPLALVAERSGPAFYLLGFGAALTILPVVLGGPLRARLAGRDRTVALVGLGLLGTGLATGVGAVAAVVPVVAAAALLLLTPDRGWPGYETVLVLAGAGLLVLVELVYVDGGAAPGRYNTLYKVFSQVWLLWGVAAGVGLAVLGRRLRETGGAPRRLVPVGLVGLVVLAAVLPGGGAVVTTVAPDGRPVTDPGLDTTRTLAEFDPDLARAVAWLRERPGRPVILEAVPTEAMLYTPRASPVSSHTGLPTVAGWTHVADYHGERAFQRRAAAVRTVYEGSDRARLAVLARHDVRYVVVGPTERERYAVAALATTPGLDPVLRSGDVTVLAVSPGVLTKTTTVRSPMSSRGWRVAS